MSVSAVGASERFQSSYINMSQFTKPKSEGRIASGKKLVEWNRKKKENLLKSSQPDQVPKQELNQVSLSTDQFSQMWYAGGIVILGLGVYLYSRKKSVKAPTEAAAVINDDIFRMIRV